MTFNFYFMKFKEISKFINVDAFQYSNDSATLMP